MADSVDLEDEVPEENRRSGGGSPFPLRDQEYGVPPTRIGGMVVIPICDTGHIEGDLKEAR